MVSTTAFGTPAVSRSGGGDFEYGFFAEQAGGFSIGTLILPKTEQWVASAHERTESLLIANPLGKMPDVHVLPPSLVVSVTPSAQLFVPSLKLPRSPTVMQSRLEVHSRVHSELPVAIAPLVNVDPSLVDRNVALVGWPFPRAPGW